MKKPAFWIIRCDRFGSTLGVNGKWYNMTPVENIKTYKRQGNAVRRLIRLGGEGFTALAVQTDEHIDCCGRILKNSD